jgi:hypothetical protein
MILARKSVRTIPISIVGLANTERGAVATWSNEQFNKTRIALD